MINYRAVAITALTLCLFSIPAAAQTTKASSAVRLPKFEVGANFSTIAGEINAPGISLTWHRSAKSAIHFTTQFRSHTDDYPAQTFRNAGYGSDTTAHYYREREGIYSLQYQRISQGPVRVSWNLALYGYWEQSTSSGYSVTWLDGNHSEMPAYSHHHTSIPFLPGTGVGFEIPVARRLSLRGDLNMIVVPNVWDGGIAVGVHAAAGVVVPFGRIR